MRFTMASDEKKSFDLPSLVIAQPQTISPSLERKSQKTKVVVAVTCVVVAILVLIAILVGIYMFTEAEKEIVKVSLQLQNGMQQEVSQNPNTNTVQLHIHQADQEAWIINDYNSDLKLMKIKSGFGTNCYVTPLNESSPTDLEKMRSPGSQVGVETVIYENTGVPIKDTSFLSKTARDACSGISTYWLYPTCAQSSNTPRNITDLSKHRKKRDTYYESECGGYYFLSTCSYQGTCSLFYCPYPQICYRWSVTFDPPGTRATCPTYRCPYCSTSDCNNCTQISP